MPRFHTNNHNVNIPGNKSHQSDKTFYCCDPILESIKAYVSHCFIFRSFQHSNDWQNVNFAQKQLAKAEAFLWIFEIKTFYFRLDISMV